MPSCVVDARFQGGQPRQMISFSLELASTITLFIGVAFSGFSIYSKVEAIGPLADKVEAIGNKVEVLATKVDKLDTSMSILVLAVATSMVFLAISADYELKKKNP